MRRKLRSNPCRINFKVLVIVTSMALFSMIVFDTSIMTPESPERRINTEVAADVELLADIDVPQDALEDEQKDWAGDAEVNEKFGRTRQEENEGDKSSYTNLDGSPYNWRDHSLADSEGLIYIHDHKLMKPPTGERAKEWLRDRCQGFKLNLEGIRNGKCFKTYTHPLVSDQRICKATKSDESYRNNNTVWAVSKSNSLYAEDMYTIVVPAFLRVDAIVRSMESFAHCAKLSSYHIVWGNPNKPAPVQKIKETWLSATQSLESRKPILHVHLMHIDTLNNRYLDLPGVNTRALLHIDDDQTTNCYDLRRLHTAWRAYPQQVVSPHVRAFSCRNRDHDQEFTSVSEKNVKDVRFVYWGPIENPFRGFECALTKFAMAHRCFSAVYSYGMEHHQGHRLGKDMVTRDLNGEDILFQGTASFVTGLPPVFLQGVNIDDIGTDDGSGISTRRNNNHFQARENIVKEITKYLGYTWVSQNFKIPIDFVTPDLKCPD